MEIHEIENGFSKRIWDSLVLAEIYSKEIKICHRENLGLATEDEIQHFSRERFCKLQFSVSGFVTGKSWLLCFPQAALNLMESLRSKMLLSKMVF